MIPKIIHRVRHPNYVPGELALRCWKSWESVLPDYTWMEWDLPNYPQTEWVKWAASNSRVRSALFDYMRYYILTHHGGIVLDTDVEMLKPFDLNHEAFCGFQRDEIEDGCVNVAVMGSVPHQPFVERLLNTCPMWIDHTGPHHITKHLRECGLKGLNVEQTIQGVKVYSKEKFYPWRWDEPIDYGRITPETRCIHWWEGAHSKPLPKKQ